MRIGIDARRAFGSGIGRVTSNLVEGLIANVSDHEFVIFGKETPSLTKFSNVEVIPADFAFFSVEDLYAFPELIERCRVDVFLAPQFYISPYLPCPSIKMVHDMWPVIFPEWIPSEREFCARFGRQSWEGLVHFAGRFLSRYSAGQIFPNNAFLEQKVRKHSSDLREIYMIGMMAETLHSSTAIIIPSIHTFGEVTGSFPEVANKLHFITNFPAPVFVHAPLAPRGGYVLHVSKWERRKNIENVIRACELVRERFDHIQLILVGDPSYPEYAQELKRLITEGGRAAWISHLGVVQDGELADLYRRADVFLYPSLYEGFGIPIIEAMASGTPVVTSNRCSMPEVAAGAALLVDPCSPTEISDAVIAVLTSATLGRYLRDKGLQRVTEFTMESAVSALKNLFISSLQNAHCETL